MNQALSDSNVLGRYELRSRLGRGGMAEVFVAVHSGAVGFERPVCIKRILPDLASDPEFRELFIREAKVAGRLCHSNIVQVFDCIEDRTELAIVTELIDGMDLRELVSILKKKKVDFGETTSAHIAGQMLNALRFAHQQRVIHRDISPHNILVSRNGEVKLADFGVAKAMMTQATKTGDLKGKLGYMSPEQAQGLSVDERTDLYSLGLVLYELVTGRRFFKGENHAELFGAVAHAKKPTLSGVSKELAHLIERLLEPDVDRRYENAEQALNDLPLWKHVGPFGSIELAGLVSEHSPESKVSRALVGEGSGLSCSSSVTESGVEQRGWSSSESASTTGSVEDHSEGAHLAENPNNTEVLSADFKRPPERPVVPSDNQAPTATREDDVEMALALAPTSNFDREELKDVTGTQAASPASVQNADNQTLANQTPTPSPSVPPSPHGARLTPQLLLGGSLFLAVALAVLIGVGGRFFIGSTGIQTQTSQESSEATESLPSLTEQNKTVVQPRDEGVSASIPGQPHDEQVEETEQQEPTKNQVLSEETSSIRSKGIKNTGAKRTSKGRRSKRQTIQNRTSQNAENSLEPRERNELKQQQTQPEQRDWQGIDPY